MPNPRQLRGHSPVQQTRSPERQAWLFALVVCCALFGLTGWRAFNAYHNDLAQGLVTTTNLAGSLAEHAKGVVRDADIVLAGLAERVHADSAPGASLERIHRLMMARVATVPSLHHLVLFSPAGDALTASFEPMPPVNVADRAYFAHHLTNPIDQSKVGPAVQNRADGHWSITISRRVETADGAFGGVVAAVIDIATFTKFYAGFDVGEHGSISLLNDDALIARFPKPASLEAFNRPLTQAWRWIGNAGSGSFTSPFDGLVRNYSFHRAGDTPLLVVAALAEDDILTNWRRDTLVALAACAVISAVLSGLTWRLAGQIRLRHRAEIAARREALRAGESEDRLATYIDHLPDGVLVIRVLPDGTIVFERANGAANGLLGIDRLTGVTADAVLSPKHADAVATNVRECIEAGVPNRFRSVISPDYGDPDRVVEVHLSPVSSTLDEPARMVLCSLRDITTQVHLQTQLLQAQRMEAVGQLTAGVAHDFNNLLQAQISGLELLRVEVRGQEKAARYVEAALDAGAQGAKLTHSLLAFSRRQVLRPEAIDVQTLIERLRVILSRALDPRIELDVRVAPVTGHPLADPAQLEAALLNLCLNARDAMRMRGGRLTLEVMESITYPGTPETFSNRESILFAVSDEGEGMDNETLARACEPFFTTKDVGKGSGLGLSMVQGFTKQSDGELHITSAIGVGTRVEIWLPQASAATIADPVDSHAAPQWHPTDTEASRYALLVDDDASVRELVGEILEQAGFDVIQAASGEQAAALLHSDLPIDVMVTDYAMPGMNGGELVHEARRLRPGLPALVITGYADNDRLCHMPPGVDVLRKPFRANQLARRVAELAQSNGPSRTSAPEPVTAD